MSQLSVDRHRTFGRLGVEEVLERLSHRLSWYGLTALSIGQVFALGEDLLMAEIVDRTGKVVRRLEVDRCTGTIRLVDGVTGSSWLSSARCRWRQTASEGSSSSRGAS